MYTVCGVSDAILDNICRSECEMICPKWSMWLAGCHVNHALSHTSMLVLPPLALLPLPLLCPSSSTLVCVCVCVCVLGERVVVCVNVLAGHTITQTFKHTCLICLGRSRWADTFDIYSFSAVSATTRLFLYTILNAYIIIACNLIKYIICVHKNIPNVNWCTIGRVRSYPNQQYHCC